MLFWTIVGAIGQAIGALATAAAVILSLWIVLSERRPKLRISAGLRLIFNGDGTPATDVISINVANVGLRAVTCTALGWRTGLFGRGPAFLRRQLALQCPAYAHGSPQLPILLEPGAEVSILQEVDAYKNAMDEQNRQSFFCRRPPWRTLALPTRIQVVISLAAHKGVFQKVEPNLAHFLATGTIQKGAAHFNQQAGLADQ